jgi:hypothetical protein
VVEEKRTVVALSEEKFQSQVFKFTTDDDMPGMHIYILVILRLHISFFVCFPLWAPCHVFETHFFFLGRRCVTSYLNS